MFANQVNDFAIRVGLRFHSRAGRTAFHADIDENNLILRFGGFVRVQFPMIPVDVFGGEAC